MERKLTGRGFLAEDFFADFLADFFALTFFCAITISLV